MPSLTLLEHFRGLDESTPLDYRRIIEDPRLSSELPSSLDCRTALFFAGVTIMGLCL